jgi:hypothetical protein
MKNVNMSIVDLINQEVENTSKLNEVKSEKRGRPVNLNSPRQIRLQELEMKRQNGDCKRGRPVDSNSERQHRLSTKSNQLGRPVDSNSVRQVRLQELEMKRQNGTLKRGRPSFKSINTSEVIDVEFEIIENVINEEVIEVKVSDLVEIKPKNKKK